MPNEPVLSSRARGALEPPPVEELIESAETQAANAARRAQIMRFHGPLVAPLERLRAECLGPTPGDCHDLVFSTIVEMLGTDRKETIQAAWAPRQETIRRLPDDRAAGDPNGACPWPRRRQHQHRGDVPDAPRGRPGH